MPKDARKIIVKQTSEQATGLVSRILKSVVRESVSARGGAIVALAGGTTPHLLYKQLAMEAMVGDVPWQQLEMFFGDERDVPPDHIESNYGMIQRTLLDNLPVEPARVHRMPADWINLDAAAAEYERAVHRIVPTDGGEIPRFDLILLGMGGDGHTASLFPYTDALNEENRLVLSHYVPVLGRKRMTFTFPLINAARHVVMMVTGADKSEAVADLLGDEAALRNRLPAARVRPTDGEFTIVLDAAASHRAGLQPDS